MPKKNNPGCRCCGIPDCPPGTTTQFCGTVQMTCPGRGGSPFNATGITVTAVGRAGQGTFSAVTNGTGTYCVVVTKIGVYDVTIEGACPITFVVTFVACSTTIFVGNKIFDMARFRFEISRECDSFLIDNPSLTGPAGFTSVGYSDPITFRQIICVSKMGTYTWSVPPLLDGSNVCINGASGSATPSCSTIPLFTGTTTAASYTATYRGIGCNGAVVDTDSITFKYRCPIPNVTLSADRYNTLVINNTGNFFTACTDITIDRTMTVAAGYQCLCCHKPITVWPKIRDALGDHVLDSTGQSDCIVAPSVTLAGDPIQCGPPHEYASFPYYYRLSCASDGTNMIWSVSKCGPACFIPILGIFCPAPGTCTGNPSDPIATTPAACPLPRTPSGACAVGTTVPQSLDDCPPASPTASINFFGWVETVTVLVE